MLLRGGAGGMDPDDFLRKKELMARLADGPSEIWHLCKLS